MPMPVGRLVKKLANSGVFGFCPSVAGAWEQYSRIMSILAAISATKPAGTALDRLKDIPPEFWMRLLFAVVAIVALVFFLRKVAKMNKVVLTVVSFVIVTVVGFNWVYERTEPQWATPMVAFLAGFFPTKGPPAAKPGVGLAHKR
jgi:hypothetical protein